MSRTNSTDRFKRDAAAQITESGAPIKEVSRRPVSAFFGMVRASARSEIMRRTERFCTSSSNGGGT